MINLPLPAAPLVLAAAVGLGLAIGLFTFAVVARPRVNKQVLGNLQRHLYTPGGEQEEKPADDTNNSLLYATARRVTSAGMVRRLERLYVRAGRPADWPMARLIVGKLVLAVVIGLLGLLYLKKEASLLALMVALVATVVAYFVPELLLHSRAQKRSEQIQLELADTLDQMTIAVEAGLGFEAAMARAGRNGKGPLAEELVHTLQAIQVGHSRRQAFDSLANRTDVADLRRFVRAVIQADMYGIAIADVLRSQAREMRLKRRQRAEEKAMQIPVKVIFPLMLCILPVLFIVLLGPAAMDIVKVFS
jgi:tight adherence protein C